MWHSDWFWKTTAGFNKLNLLSVVLSGIQKCHLVEQSSAGNARVTVNLHDIRIDFVALEFVSVMNHAVQSISHRDVFRVNPHDQVNTHWRADSVNIISIFIIILTNGLNAKLFCKRNSALCGVFLSFHIYNSPKNVLGISCLSVGCQKNHKHTKFIQQIASKCDFFFFLYKNSSIFFPSWWGVCENSHYLSSDWHFSTEFVCSPRLVNSPQPTMKHLQLPGGWLPEIHFQAARETQAGRAIFCTLIYCSHFHLLALK